MKQDNVFELIKLSIWGNGSPTVDWSVFQEMKNQAIVALPASVLSSLNLPLELMSEWRYIVFQQIALYELYQYVQLHLPIEVPYIILKGSSAAQYYPHPEYRTIGDIDIITRREDYESACEMLLKDAWHEMTHGHGIDRERHRAFVKNGITIEVHAFFASMNDVRNAKTFDDLIMKNITEKHVLPDLINGLVLIEHVNQHMEEGIGLKQIIDWMMFVDRCLSDDKWTEFEMMTEETGLKELAVTTTRMCEMYLGLPEHKWSKGADEKLSRNLMEYIMRCGNFGAKRNETDMLSVSGLYQLRHPITTIRNLQQKGQKGLAIAKKPILKPFIWIVEGIRRICKVPKLLGQYQNARKTNALFKSLGITRFTEGLVYYKEGQYFKK